METPALAGAYTVTNSQVDSDPVDGNWILAATLVPLMKRSAVLALVPACRKVNDLVTDESKYTFQ